MFYRPKFRVILSLSLGGLLLSGCMGFGLKRYSRFMMQNFPDQYQGQSNPLPSSQQNTDAGRQLFEDNCAVCHGVEGKGDGALSTTLSPRPANLLFTRRLPIATDAFFLWTISEGGTRYRSAMPSFADTLSKKEIWQIIGYVKNDL